MRGLHGCPAPRLEHNGSNSTLTVRLDPDGPRLSMKKAPPERFNSEHPLLHRGARKEALPIDSTVLTECERASNRVVPNVVIEIREDGSIPGLLSALKGENRS